MYTSTIGPFNMLCNWTVPECSVVLLIKVNLDNFGNPSYTTWLEQIYQSCQIWSCIEDGEIPQDETEINSAFLQQGLSTVCTTGRLHVSQHLLFVSETWSWIIKAFGCLCKLMIEKWWLIIIRCPLIWHQPWHTTGLTSSHVSGLVCSYKERMCWPFCYICILMTKMQRR